MSSIKSYFILIRPYGLLFLGFTPVLSAISMGDFEFNNLAVLFLIGMLAHIFVFVQNDYYDIKIDKESKYVSKRPLVSGNITERKAAFLYMGSFFLAIILAIVFVFSIFSFLVLLSTFLFLTLYNKYSKRFFGMEYVLSLGVFSCGIFGALTVSNNITLFPVLISAFAFMQWLFSVGISANLKDVEFDTKQGVRTTPTVFGVKVTNKKTIMPFSFKLYAFGIKIIHILIAGFPFLLGYSSIYVFNLPIPGIFFLLISIILLYLTLRFINTNFKKG